jgi:hypothetical protein
MKQLKWLSILSILLMPFAACDDDDNEYEGTNEIFLIANGEKTLTESEDKTIDITVQLTRTLKEDATITFKFENQTSDKSEVLSFVNNPIVIKAGEKSDTLHIKSQQRDILTQNTTFAIQMDKVSDDNITLNAPLQLTVKPNPQFTPLTEEQQKLLNAYKNKGLDLSPWIGIIPVEVKITYPGDGSLDKFSKSYEKTITGKTVITLSDYATEDLPTLVMTENAMGLEGYIYDLFRDETIWDDVFWLNYPNPPKAMELISLTKESEETFVLSLDSLIFKDATKTIDFVRDDKAINSYGEPITGVAFDYSYSAWDRMQKLITEGNKEAQDYEEGGSSVNPDKYINISSIDTDEWAWNKADTWVEASSSFNSETGIMKFIFVFDHANAGGYVKAEVTYTSPQNNE